MMKKTTKRKGFDELPFDFIASEILSRIPSTYDIGLCRCVCKQWNSFLSTPMFNRSHLRRHVSIDDYELLLLSDFKTPLAVNFNPNPAVHRFLASLDGLVCLGSKHRSAVPMVFWNPFTGAYKNLSSIPSMLSPRGYHVRDPIGFFIDSSNDYKLVCLIDSGWAHVYSNRLDSWRKIECSLTRQGDMDRCGWSKGTFCGQCVYFIAYPYFIKPGCVLCFDVETETFRKIPYPPILDGASVDYRSRILVVLNGGIHLSVSSTVFNPDLMHGDLWRLDDGDEWVKVSAFSNPVEQKSRRMCTTSIGDWLAVLYEGEDSMKKMNTENFMSRYRCFCSLSAWYRYSRIVYAKTLVSP